MLTPQASDRPSTALALTHAQDRPHSWDCRSMRPGNARTVSAQLAWLRTTRDTAWIKAQCRQHIWRLNFILTLLLYRQKNTWRVQCPKYPKRSETLTLITGDKEKTSSWIAIVGNDLKFWSQLSGFGFHWHHHLGQEKSRCLFLAFSSSKFERSQRVETVDPYQRNILEELSVSSWSWGQRKVRFLFWLANVSTTFGTSLLIGRELKKCKWNLQTKGSHQ